LSLAEKNANKVASSPGISLNSCFLRLRYLKLCKAYFHSQVLVAGAFFSQLSSKKTSGTSKEDDNSDIKGGKFRLNSEGLVEIERLNLSQKKLKKN